MSSTTWVETAFRDHIGALSRGDLATFYGTMAPDAVLMDEDLPFPVEREAYEDHIGFHVSGIWSEFSWHPFSETFLDEGDSGVVVGFAMFRGKPVDAGYRLRPMIFSQCWAREDGEARLVAWHLSPVVGHVSEQSPG